MKKQYIFSFFLFFFFAYQCIGQENKPAPHLHIGNRYKAEQIKLNVAEAKPILYRKYDEFYIAEIKDNQLENTNCIGKVRQGDFTNIYMERVTGVAPIIVPLSSSNPTASPTSILYDTETGDYYTMPQEDYPAIFADYPDFLTRLHYTQADFHADLIQEFVQKLNTKNHGLKMR